MHEQPLSVLGDAYWPVVLGTLAAVVALVCVFRANRTFTTTLRFVLILATFQWFWFASHRPRTVYELDMLAFTSIMPVIWLILASRELAIWYAARNKFGQAFVHTVRWTDSGCIAVPPVADLVGQLRYRARRQRTRSNAFLVLLVLVIAGTASIYVFASNISSSTFGLANGLSRLEYYDELLSTHLEIAKASQQRFRISLQLAAERGGTRSKESEISELLDLYGDYVSESDRRIRAAIKDHRAYLVSFQDEQNRAKATNRTDEYRFWSTLSTRVGSILILVFLAQFLISAYRYTSRLAAAYDSRADALCLNWQDAQEARRFMSVDDFSLEKVKAPTEEAIEIAKQLINRKVG